MNALSVRHTRPGLAQQVSQVIALGMLLDEIAQRLPQVVRDAQTMGIWTRERAADLSELIHHSDRGVRYGAVRYGERLAEICCRFSRVGRRFLR